MEFSTPPPLPVIPALPTNTNGTLRRGGGASARAMVPPPDVTHHTQHSALNSTTSSGGVGPLNISQVSSSTPKQPQGILKDPNKPRNQASGGSQQQQQQVMNHLNSIGGGLQMLGVVQQGQLNPSPVPSMIPGGPGSGGLIVPVSGSSLGNNLLIGTYDPSSTNLSSFNASLGYTDADGHLV